MKKFLLVLLVAMLVFSMVACSIVPETDNTHSSDEKTGESTTENQKPEDTLTESKQPVLSGKIWKVPTYDIYVTCPNEWITSERYGVQAIFKDKDAMVAVTYCLEDEISDDLESVIVPATKSIIQNAYIYCAGGIADSSVEVKSTSECKMGGFDSLQFTGVIPNSNGYDCHTYGYSFIINGVGIVVCGIVSAPEQDPAMIAQIDALTDQVAASVRTEK